jgi:hypothetical protein
MCSGMSQATDVSLEVYLPPAPPSAFSIPNFASRTLDTRDKVKMKCNKAVQLEMPHIRPMRGDSIPTVARNCGRLRLCMLSPLAAGFRVAFPAVIE